MWNSSLRTSLSTPLHPSPIASISAHSLPHTTMPQLKAVKTDTWLRSRLCFLCKANVLGLCPHCPRHLTGARHLLCHKCLFRLCFNRLHRLDDVTHTGSNIFMTLWFYKYMVQIFQSLRCSRTPWFKNSNDLSWASNMLDYGGKSLDLPASANQPANLESKRDRRQNRCLFIGDRHLKLQIFASVHEHD